MMETKPISPISTEAPLASLATQGDTGPLATTALVDTSIQIERLKTTDAAGRAEKLVRSFAFSATSSFALLEFKGSWLQDLVLLHRYASESETLADVQDKVNKLASVRQSYRRVQRLLAQIAGFLRLEDPNTTLAVAVVKLRAHLATSISGSWQRWNRSVTHHFDGTGCVRAKEALVRSQANGRFDVCVPDCKPGKVECQIEQFFAQHMCMFRRIAEAIEKLGQSASAELKAARGFIRQAEKKPDVLHDSRICRKIGDILIAVDGERMGTFIANNDNEWVPIARALGKALVNPVNKTSHDFSVPHHQGPSEQSGEYISIRQARTAESRKFPEGKAL